MRRNSAKAKSQHFRDPIRAIVRGYSSRIRSTYGAENLFIETRDLGLFLYPSGKMSHDLLRVRHQSKNLVNILEALFLGRGRVGVEFDFGHTHSLLHFLSYMHQQAALYGKSHAEVIWQKNKIKSREYDLPVAFSPIPEETVRKREGGYVQSYNPITRLGLFESYKISYKTTYFQDDEILGIGWAFGNGGVWPRVKNIYTTKKKYMETSLSAIQATSEPNTRSYRLLKASQASGLKREYEREVSELKTKREMKLAAAMDGFSPTQYYDAYLLYSYARDKIFCLKSYIKEVNVQVLQPFATRNGYKKPPIIEYVGVDEAFLDGKFQDYKNGSVTYEECIEEISKVI